MKKIVIFFILLYMVVFPAIVLADTGGVEAGLTPDSRFYWFDRMAERIVTLFLLHPQDKVNALSKIGLERLAEAQEINDDATISELISEFLITQKNIQLIAGKDIDSLVDLSEDQLVALDLLDDLLEYGEGEIEHRADDAIFILKKILEKQIIRLSKIDLDKYPHKAIKVRKVISKTTDRLNKLIDRLAKDSDDSQEEASDDGSGIDHKKTLAEKKEHVTAATSKHLEVLKNKLEKAPEPAKAAIKKAIDKSSNGRETASGAVGREGPPEDPANNTSSSNKPSDDNPSDENRLEDPH